MDEHEWEDGFIEFTCLKCVYGPWSIAVIAY